MVPPRPSPVGIGERLAREFVDIDDGVVEQAAGQPMPDRGAPALVALLPWASASLAPHDKRRYASLIATPSVDTVERGTQPSARPSLLILIAEL